MLINIPSIVLYMMYYLRWRYYSHFKYGNLPTKGWKNVFSKIKGIGNERAEYLISEQRCECSLNFLQTGFPAWTSLDSKSCLTPRVMGENCLCNGTTWLDFKGNNGIFKKIVAPH